MNDKKETNCGMFKLNQNSNNAKNMFQREKV